MPLKPKISFSFKGDQYFEPIAKWFTQLMEHHFQIQIIWQDENSTLLIGTHNDCHLKFSVTFQNLIKNKIFNHDKWFINTPELVDELGQTDYLGTVFFMVNSLQEFDSKALDQYQRFDFFQSYQHKFNCVEEDLVSVYLEKIRDKYLKAWIPHLPLTRSNVFLSHDMDRIASAKRTEIGNALKNFQPINTIERTFKALQNKLGWNDTKYFMDLHEKHGFTSTFFWLVAKGTGEDRIQNADYSFNEFISKKVLSSIEERGFTNGLHKAALDDSSFNIELNKIPHSYPANRNHYLRMQLPEFYNKLSRSNIKFDSTLGFSDAAGFRNSYGKAFIPFNLKENKAHNFVEYPLQLMDVTLCIKQFGSPENAWPFIESFLEKHQFNTDLSILFHNNYLTNGVYKSWHILYKRILQKLDNLSIRSISPKDVVDRFSEL
jgi:hypothetical protein